MFHAFVLINGRPERLHDLAQEIADTPGVSQVHSTAGPVDLVAVLGVADNEAVADIVTQRIAPLDGIVSTQTLISFRVYSAADIEAAYDGLD